MKGKPVRSLPHLMRLVEQRRAVTLLHSSFCRHRHIPASWVANTGGARLHYLFKHKLIREHVKQK